MIDNGINVHTLDAAYKAFPTFSDWAARSVIDTIRWNRYNESLNRRSTLPNEVLRRALEIAKRAAAIDTGAIEGLYEVDQGFTYTVAFETAAWEAALASKGENVRPLFEAQLHAYDFVLDLATKAEPISEAAIRALHEEVCRAQETYSVMTAIGPQEQPLPKGQYKVLPNHVLTRKGENHSYAPVDMTPPEMARLVAEMRGEEFLAAHPVMQAAYAHYGLVVIHPFSDGNGRVARALASAFTYRAISMPIVILSDYKARYLEALEDADAGDYQAFVSFMLSASLETINFVDECVRAALVPTLESSTEAIARLYFTKGGYTHDQVDEGGKNILTAILNEVRAIIARNSSAKLRGTASLLSSGHGLPPTLKVELVTDPPAAATVQRQYRIAMPKDAAHDDDIQFFRDDKKDSFVARMNEVVPSISAILQIRITVLSERIVGEMLADLRSQAQAVHRLRS